MVPYDPAWVSDYAAEAESIRDALGQIVVKLHHIGSTAIPGIYAKPIIDILLEVTEIAELDAHVDRMQNLGYVARGEFGIPRRRYFQKNDSHGVRTHQVHSFQADDPEVERHLAYRDYMIAHPSAAQAYSDLKRRVAQEHPHDIDGYMDGKDAFIKEHEAKALAWRASQPE